MPLMPGWRTPCGRYRIQVPEVAKLYQCDDSWSYNITNAEGGVAEVNYKRVEVTITVATVLNNLPCGYCVESRAIGDDSGI